ncbi:MAG: uracil-DNA glycosylase [Bacillati bacterium ANGP1]|uniref:Type-5 uracil-DNA glycosylase n=1 Tax=Candidatus Segetimicrobium genomatis TaxID=2569760 RepID=A0A537JBC3_9BACT|nr:MAG: uracil-DNA glycosylase [Terrabacteria group bacterium ANGP1]
MRRAGTLRALAREVVACTACPRLRRYCARVAARGKREFAGWTYWGKPVPGFGDPRARLLIVGLAPAAHGANRTGRMFTGDGSGAWLVRAMHRAGFANQPISLRREDGLRLDRAYITAAVRCAPPENKPTPREIARCAPFLEREAALLPDVGVILALGRIGFEACRRMLAARGAPVRGLRFAHGAVHPLGPSFPTIVTCYHPSRQNTNTGRLTEAMLDRVFETIRGLLAGATPEPVGRSTGR